MKNCFVFLICIIIFDFLYTAEHTATPASPAKQGIKRKSEEFNDQKKKVQKIEPSDNHAAATNIYKRQQPITRVLAIDEMPVDMFGSTNKKLLEEFLS